MTAAVSLLAPVEAASSRVPVRVDLDAMPPDTDGYGAILAALGAALAEVGAWENDTAVVAWGLAEGMMGGKRVHVPSV